MEEKREKQFRRIICCLLPLCLFLVWVNILPVSAQTQLSASAQIQSAAPWGTETVKETRAYIGVLVPTMASMIEMYGYVAGIIEAANNSSFVIVFAVEFACFGYIVITYLLEKIHAYWHEEEGTFAMCVDMLCIENIVLYVFNLLCYVISIIFQSLSLSDMFYGVIIFIFALPTMWGFLLQVIYSAINMSISMVIPAAIAYLLMYVVGETLAYVIMIILILLFSQVVWRLCSGFIYDKLLRGFSHNHLSLSD